MIIARAVAVTALRRLGITFAAIPSTFAANGNVAIMGELRDSD